MVSSILVTAFSSEDDHPALEQPRPGPKVQSARDPQVNAVPRRSCHAGWAGTTKGQLISRLPLIVEEAHHFVRNLLVTGVEWLRANLREHVAHVLDQDKLSLVTCSLYPQGQGVGCGWATDKTPLDWARPSDPEFTSHANCRDFPLPWSGDITTDANFCRPLPGGGASRPRMEPGGQRVFGSSPSASTTIADSNLGTEESTSNGFGVPSVEHRPDGAVPGW
jgi:hypothetical protein